MVILQQDRAMPQGVQLSGVGDGCLSGRIAVRIIEFCRPADAGGALDNSINLALPATSENFFDLIFVGNELAGRKNRIGQSVSFSFFHSPRYMKSIMRRTRNPVNCRLY